MRLDGKGLIDRTQPLQFTFDGRVVDAFAGDSVASALLAEGTRLMGRSFKYHRPRGVVSAGSDEPNALMTIGRGQAQTPNVRAPMQEVYHGLQVRSQNAWPSLGRDAMAVNDLASQFLSAGFYYKTFMWPPKFWEKLYEPLIRRAAGLGALSGLSADDDSEKAYAFCDLLVIGAGPAGLMAAMVAARAGIDVLICDEADRLGGRLLGEDETIGDQAGSDWVASAQSELLALGARIMTRTTVTGAYDGGIYGALERVSLHKAEKGHAPRETFWRITAPKAILAAGGHERHIAFANNDRPGIMGAAAMRTYLHRYGISPGKSVAVFGNNDDAHRTARDLAAAGVKVAALLDSRDEVLVDGDFPVLTGARITDTKGRLGLDRIDVTHSGGQRTIWAECLAVSGGWNPAVNLTCHMNGRPVWRDDIAAFVPRPDAVPGLHAAGLANGVFSTAECLEDGARAVCEAFGLTKPRDLPRADRAPYRIRPLWQIPTKKRAWLDFQNDVTTKDIVLAAQENYRSVEHMKRYTTQGMATDQGKGSNVMAVAILADATGRTIPQTGTTTYRPPYTPVSIAAMGGGARGVGFAPQRFATSHAASIAMGAPMIEAGLWYRPSYFPRNGETTWLEACTREARMVRQSVGICDVSTLGKVDLQGPDAAAFLDFVYTNGFATLKEGRVRYGLMLREDGHIMDDGTVARLGPQHYVITTTTAAAGNVMRHLQFAHQCLMPHLDLAMISVTEHWAQFAVAGPQSRALLSDVLDTPLSGDDWPYMACGPVTLGGVSGRLFRISFSGEHAYELAVPARYGDTLFRQLVAKAEERDGGAYGMEALNVLRLEKGHVTHAEIDGRVTAFDIGMDRMMSTKKDFIGKTMAARPGLSGPDRAQMVGLASNRAMMAGAHLFAQGVPFQRDHSAGYVTSVGYSPQLDAHIALGFLQNGQARLGEVIVLKDHLRGIEAACEVCPPCFVDPDGDRLRD